nr:hypothetical protein [Mycobacterium bohemicum]
MTVQDDKAADRQDGPEGAQHADREANDEAGARDNTKPTEHDSGRADGSLPEMPEVDENAKNAASEMMGAYEEKPTIVLPGSGGTVSGTAVNDWLDDEGNPKYEVPDGADSSEADQARNDEKKKEQIEKDKELNKKLAEAASSENKGEKD